MHYAFGVPLRLIRILSHLLPFRVLIENYFSSQLNAFIYDRLS